MHLNIFELGTLDFLGFFSLPLRCRRRFASSSVSSSDCISSSFHILWKHWVFPSWHILVIFFLFLLFLHLLLPLLFFSSSPSFSSFTLLGWDNSWILWTAWVWSHAIAPFANISLVNTATTFIWASHHRSDFMFTNELMLACVWLIAAAIMSFHLITFFFFTRLRQW